MAAGVIFMQWRFPAEGLLRAFTFETGRPIKYGAGRIQGLRPGAGMGLADGRRLQVLERAAKRAAYAAGSVVFAAIE
jgi:hypothetical protein